ncbi:MAG: hypothetical protein WC529_08885 [Candidatus Margulisiibacteriota bacterium]
MIDRLLKLPDLSGAEATLLTADAAAAAVALSVVNIGGFADDDFVIVGHPGEEDAEIVQVTAAPSGTTIAVGALSRAHSAQAPVMVAAYNKVKVYRSDTEGGTYAEITGSPFALEIDQPFTNVIDPTGTAAKYYKFSYYNSQTLAESDKSVAYLGGKPAGLCSLEELKEELSKDLGDKVSDALLIRCIDEATDRIIQYTGVQFVSKTIVDEYHDSNGGDCFFTDYYPIQSVTSLYDNGTLMTYNADPDLTEYHIKPGHIKLESSSFYPGANRIKISYVAYKEPPEEVKGCAIKMAAILSGLKTRTYFDEAGQTQSYLISKIPDDIWTILKKYKRRTI